MRHYFSFLSVSLMLLPLTAAMAGNQEKGTREIILCGEKITAASHVIVLPKAATPSENHAALELKNHLETMTGTELPIVPETDATKANPIYIGKCTLPKSLGIEVDWKKLGLEGIHIETSGKALVLAGGKRGALYAVYTFLEDYLGCRWFTADCVTIPNTGKVKIKSIKKVYVPALEFRDTDYPSARPPEFSVRNRLNGPHCTIDAKWGGRISYKGFVHTFNTLVPPAKYAKDHPEYYSEIDGVRVTDRTQLCLTNPDVIRIATENVRKWMRETPDATIFSVSQNDWDYYCTCPKCTALAEKEGSQAGPLIHFVNAIADAVKDEFPNKAVDTLAYRYTRKPPKFVKPSPNVIVRLCSIECCFSHPLSSCRQNSTFVEDIKGWNKLTNRLHIWDYVINYAHCIMPFPNFRVLKPNINFFIKHGVTGIYEEANYFSKAGEMAELRAYVLAKCLWEPKYSDKKAIREFTDAYYGKAGELIRDYLELIHDKVAGNSRIHMGIYSAPKDYLNDDKMLTKAGEIFDEAEKLAADDPVLLNRVKIARMPLTYTLLSRNSNLYKLDINALVCNKENNNETLLADFAAMVKASGATHIREGGNIQKWLAAQLSTKHPLVLRTIQNQYLKLDILPDLGGRIWRAQDVRTGKQLFKIEGDQENGFIPQAQGYEEYSNTDYRGPGFCEQYKMLDSGPTFVKMAVELPNGVTLTRRIELLPDRAAFKVTSKVTTAAKVAQKAFRVHPVFSVTDTNKTKVYVKLAAGWKEINLANPVDPAAEKDLWMRGENCPQGQWAIADEGDNTVIINTFNASGVDFCYLNWKGAEARVNPEIWSKAVPADKDKGPVLENTYEVIPLDKAPFKK